VPGIYELYRATSIRLMKNLQEHSKTHLNAKYVRLSVLNLQSLAADDERRFDGVTIAAFKRGRPMEWDLTITHTCAPNHHVFAINVRAAAAHSHALKTQNYADMTEGFDFGPFDVEALGAFGRSALGLIESSRIYGRLSIAVKIGNT